MNLEQFNACATDSSIPPLQRIELLQRAATAWHAQLQAAEQALRMQDNEVKSLRAKVTKYKRKVGTGKSKTAALRNLQNLRRQKLEQLDKSHKEEERLLEERASFTSVTSDGDSMSTSVT